MNNKFQPFKNLVSAGNNIRKILSPEPIIKNGIKKIKYWIDDNFREKVKPKKGSVLYTNLSLIPDNDILATAEHSGIYVGNDKISNILIDEFSRGKVKKSSPERFTKKSKMYKKIYVSCDKNGSVGDLKVSKKAKSYIGEEYFYGLIFNNCHDFSQKCLDYTNTDYIDNFKFELSDIDETWEHTIRRLKKKAKRKIGAAKWKLWDWKSNSNKTKNNMGKPDLKEILNFLKKIPLNKDSINYIKSQKDEAEEYKSEISDENIPDSANDILNNFITEIKKIDSTYDEVKEFIKITGQSYSYNQIKEINEDFSSLVKEMQNNQKISELVNKLGREYISKEKKLKTKISRRSKKELFGIHHSSELERVLTNELVNLENEELEYLFYSRYLEESLLAFELSGKIKSDTNKRIKGPIIACLDTSGSMAGQPIIKAKSLLLLIINILEEENRSLHIILFGNAGDIEELNVNNNSENPKLLSFLNKGFGGGTNFESPLKRSIEIIENKRNYNKADVLIITDGANDISTEFKDYLLQKKVELNFNIYSVLTNEKNNENDFSDEIITI